MKFRSVLFTLCILICTLWIQPVGFVNAASSLAPPTDLKNVNIGGNSFDVIWPRATNATHYHIYQSTESGAQKLVAVVPQEGAVQTQLDLVFLVDDSGSMDQYILKVTKNLTSYINTFISNNIDVRLGMVQFADLSCEEPMYKTNFTTSLPEFIEKLKSIKTGRGCSEGESHLEAIAKPPEGALYFNFRPTASKQFILVTDEPAQKTMDIAKITKQLLDKGIVMHVIGPTKGEAYDQFSQFTKATKGIYLNLQESNYNKGLQSMAGTLLTSKIYKFSGLTEYTKYTTRIEACDANGCSPKSAPLTTRTLDVSPPTKPTNLKAVKKAAGFIELDWDPSTDTPGSGVRQYEVYVNGKLQTTVNAPDSAAKITGIDVRQDYTIAVRAVDGVKNRSSFQKIFNNEISGQPPTDILLSSNQIFENQPSDTSIGSFTAVDKDNPDKFKYELIAGQGSKDNANFRITGSQLRSAVVFDYEERQKYEIRVKVTDSFQFRYEKKFIIQIKQEPKGLSATDTSLEVTEDVPETATLPAYNPLQSAITFQVKQNPTKGKLELVDKFKGTYRYTPNLNVVGTDGFSFVVSDGTKESNLANVKITIKSVNDAPRAKGGLLNVVEDTPKTGTLLATDVDNKTLEFVLVTQAKFGKVTITNSQTGEFRYVPNADYFGEDQFTFRARDGEVESNLSTVAIQVSDTYDLPDIKVGDYIQFGKYYDEPIVWRVIDKKNKQEALLLADRILTIKAFDARGPVHKDSVRRSVGSNLYVNSNLRQWLNSADMQIKWTQNEPISKQMRGGRNGYALEKGFLADGNFTAAERAMLQLFRHSVILPKEDMALKDSGTDFHKWSTSVRDAPENYAQAYQKTYSDRVLLLSVQQLKNYIYDREQILGADFIKAKPTNQAVARSEYKNFSLDSDRYWSYWLNTPYSTHLSNVRVVNQTGIVEAILAANESVGVRPAISLKFDAATHRLAGTGALNQPYNLE